MRVLPLTCGSADKFSHVLDNEFSGDVYGAPVNVMSPKENI